MRFGRKQQVTVVMDDKGVRKMRGTDVPEQVAWPDLVKVDIATTSDGPGADDVYWVLHGSDGNGVAVPSERMPEGLLERLQALAGFDNSALISAMGSTGDAVFHCWERA